jgi:hypothetical protein
VFVGSIVVILGIFLQAFSISAYVRGAGDGALDMHGGVSMIVHLGELAIVIGAITAWWGNWRVVGLALGFFVLSIAQVAFLGDTEKEGDWINGLHGFLAILVLVCAALYFHKAKRELGVMGSGSSSPGGA